MNTTNAEQIIGSAKFSKFHVVLLLWGGLLMLFDGYDLTIYGAVVPTLMEEWGITSVETGMIGSYALIGMTVGALLFGTIADKLGRKKTIIICTTIFSAFMLFTAFATSPEMFGVFRFITGLGLGGVMPNVIALISDYSPKGTRSRMIATIMAGYSIGGVIASLLSIVLITNFGWQSVFLFGALPILFIPFLIRTLPDTVGSLIARNKHDEVKEILLKANSTYQPAENETFVMNTVNEKSSPVATLFTERRAFSTIMLWLAYFMSLLMIYGLNTWLPKLMNEAGYALGSSLSFLLALNVGATIGAVLMGWIADRWGVKKSLILFYLIAFLSITSLGFVSNTIALYALVTIAGAATIGTQNIANSYTSQYYPAHVRSTGLGWALGVGRLGGITGPTIGGILLASSLVLQVNFLVFAIPGVIAALAIFLTNRNTQQVSVTEGQSHLG